jgi:signal transduction histidine kinase
VTCDPRQLDEALVNLAVNARDAMPHGGDLMIEGRKCPEAAHGTRCVVIDVIDGGCGMPPDVVERAFRPFFTTKGPGKGTGLGLTAVRNFVEQSGGSVDIRSAQARGTCVRLHLPAPAQS